MKNCVFIHTNERQWIGALVSQYSLKRNSANPDAFDVRIIHVKDFPFLAEREGQSFLRGGTTRVWRMSDLLVPTQHPSRSCVSILLPKYNREELQKVSPT